MTPFILVPTVLRGNAPSATLRVAAADAERRRPRVPTRSVGTRTRLVTGLVLLVAMAGCTALRDPMAGTVHEVRKKREAETVRRMAKEKKYIGYDVISGEYTGEQAGQNAYDVTMKWKEQNPDLVEKYSTWAKDLGV